MSSSLFWTAIVTWSFIIVHDVSSLNLFIPSATRIIVYGQFQDAKSRICRPNTLVWAGSHALQFDRNMSDTSDSGNRFQLRPLRRLSIPLRKIGSAPTAEFKNEQNRRELDTESLDHHFKEKQALQSWRNFTNSRQGVAIYRGIIRPVQIQKFAARAIFGAREALFRSRRTAPLPTVATTAQSADNRNRGAVPIQHGGRRR
jgi:hypothetical protein